MHGKVHEDIGSGDDLAMKVSGLLTKNAEKGRDGALALMHRLLFQYADGNLNYWSDGTFQSASIGE